MMPITTAAPATATATFSGRLPGARTPAAGAPAALASPAERRTGPASVARWHLQRLPGAHEEGQPQDRVAGIAVTPLSKGGTPVTTTTARRRTLTAAVIAIAAVAGVVIGLVIWTPWASPPLLGPAGLTAGPSTTGSVAFHWSRPATGPAPDSYVILRAGTVIGSVRGTVTFYRQAGLAPATAYRYQVAAVRGGKRSALSSALVVSTAIPPLAAARLAGPWTVQLKLVRRGGLIGARRWTESWLTSPTCATGSCAEILSGSIGGYRFTAQLDRSSARYTGTTRARLFPCRSGASSFPLWDTMTFHLQVTGAHVVDRAWTASSWTGGLVMSNPYTSSGNLFCPASSQTAALSSHP